MEFRNLRSKNSTVGILGIFLSVTVDFIADRSVYAKLKLYKPGVSLAFSSNSRVSALVGEVNLEFLKLLQPTSK